MTDFYKSNRTLGILNAAVQGKYGVLAAIAYNVEHLTALLRAAETKRSPLIILLFPSTIKQLPSLAWAASWAIKSASVPLALHLDHAQDEAQIREVVETLPFDSIMVDMSHYGHEKNLAKTKELSSLCHSHGIAVEAESGRINGDEDGIAGTGDLEGNSFQNVSYCTQSSSSLCQALFTTTEEVEDFLESDIDLLAPSIGNIHGDYGLDGPQLDFDRLTRIGEQVRGRLLMALHGTNDFTPAIMQRCINAGTVKLNVNKLLLEGWNVHLRENSNLPLMQLIDQGMDVIQKETEKWMDICGSSGKATDSFSV